MIKKFIPLSVPSMSGKEWKFVKNCLDTNWVSSAGAYVSEFEKRVANWVGVKEAISTTSGTTALHLALSVINVQPDDEVLVPALSFVATANAVRYRGAWPVFIDIDPITWQMTPELIEEFILKKCSWKKGKLWNKETKRVIKGILPVHLFGFPCDMKSLMSLARKYSLFVVEDAAQGMGAYFNKKSVGSWGDVGCFSFNGNKIITTGGGGMLVTNNSVLAKKARSLSSQSKKKGLEYFHESIGYNYRMTNIQAAIGLGQMDVLSRYLKKKRKIYSLYYKEFSKIDLVRTAGIISKSAPSFWLFPLQLVSKLKPLALIKYLKSENIEAGRFWIPLPNLPMYKNSYCFGRGIADSIYSKGVSLPSSVSLSVDDQSLVIQKVLKFLSQKN